MNIVESQRDLDAIVSYLTTDHFVLDVVCVDADKHAANNHISLLFFYFLTSKTFWCLPVKHPEAVILPHGLNKVRDVLSLGLYKKYVFDKKSVVQLLGADYGFTDVSLLRYFNDGTVDNNEYKTNAHVFVGHNFRNIPNTNVCVPIYKHARSFYNKIESFVEGADLSGSDEPGFKFVNETMTSCFARLESNGLAVNDGFLHEFGDEHRKHIRNGLVFTQYNFLTSTGRPSNRFGGINYAALNKTDESRTCFVSRHGKDGMLVMMDYNAFHPRLIAHLANFHMEASTNPYAYLASYFFNKPVDKVDEEDIAVSKQFTFTQIYGGFDQKWLHIPYFSKVQHYIDHRWKFFEENGYVETPKYRRKIKPCHIGEANPNKLFNYILQAFETEMAVDVLSELLTELRDKKTLPVLYTYDSILFDAHKNDGLDTLRKIKVIMEGGKFPVKVYVGNNYKDMRSIKVL